MPSETIPTGRPPGRGAYSRGADAAPARHASAGSAPPVFDLVAWYTLSGVLVGIVCGTLLFWFIEVHIAGIVEAEASRRAVDQVHLGVLSSATPADLEAPHTAEKAEDLRLRLQPLLSRVAEHESGIVGLNIIADDGTVVYSDTPGAQGVVIPPGEQQLLAGALAGRVKVARSELTGPEHAQRRAQYPSAIEVYVPIVFDGSVLGAYEIYEDATFLETTAQLAAAIVVVSTCLVFHVLGRVVARRRRLVDAAPSVVSAAPLARPLRRASGAFRPSRGPDLTPRERQVLALLATSDSYHEIAQALVVSDETVRTHVKRILRKLQTPNRTQAVVLAMRTGILTPPALESWSPLANHDGPPSPNSPCRVTHVTPTRDGSPRARA